MNSITDTHTCDNVIMHSALIEALVHHGRFDTVESTYVGEFENYELTEMNVSGMFISEHISKFSICQ